MRISVILIIVLTMIVVFAAAFGIFYIYIKKQNVEMHQDSPSTSTFTRLPPEQQRFDEFKETWDIAPETTYRVPGQSISQPKNVPLNVPRT